jgi:subfamily B ATP-binding cassette protein MsbA
MVGALHCPGPDSATAALVARLLRDYLRRHATRIALAFGCMLVVALTTAAFPKLIQPVVDDIFVARRPEMLWPIALAALAVFVARGVAAYGQAVLMTTVGQSIVARMQNDLFRRLIGADLAFYSESSPGGLVARFINDVNLLRNAASNTLTGLGKDALTAAALVAVMFYEDWLLAAIAFVAFPTAVLPILRIGRRLRRISGRTQQQVGGLTTLLDETFQGIRHVKAYGMEAYETARAEDAIDELFRLNVKAAKTRNALHPIMELLGGDRRRQGAGLVLRLHLRPAAGLRAGQAPGQAERRPAGGPGRGRAGLRAARHGAGHQGEAGGAGSRDRRRRGRPRRRDLRLWGVRPGAL